MVLIVKQNLLFPYKGRGLCFEDSPAPIFLPCQKVVFQLAEQKNNSKATVYSSKMFIFSQQVSVRLASLRLISS